MSCVLYVVLERAVIYSILVVRNRNTVKLHTDYMYCNYLNVFPLLRALQSFRQRLFELCFQLVQFRQDAGDPILTLRPLLNRRTERKEISGVTLTHI